MYKYRKLLNIIDTATKQHIYIIDMLNILYCKVFNKINKDYTEIRGNAIQGLEYMIKKFLKPFITKLNEFGEKTGDEGEDEDQMGGAPPGEEIAVMKKSLSNLQKEVEDFQGLLKTGKCISVDGEGDDEDDEDDEGEGRHFSVLLMQY